MLQTLYSWLLIACLAGGGLHYRHQACSDALPPAHPRRRRAKLLYPYIMSMVGLAAVSCALGPGALGFDVFFPGFILWFIALWLRHKGIPREDEILAYEEAEKAQTQQQPAVETPEFAVAEEAARPRRKAYAAASSQPQEEVPRERGPTFLPHTPSSAADRNLYTRGSVAWAQFELGITQTATRDDVADAYRRLMRMSHPDHGGDTAIAADLNLAREVLLANLL